MSLAMLRGRNFTLLIVALLLGLTLLAPILTGLASGSHDLLSHALRLLLTAALGYQLYQGRVWARWLLVVLTLLAGAATLLGGIAVTSQSLAGAGMLLTLAALYFLIAGLLLFSRDVRAYLSYRGSQP